MVIKRLVLYMWCKDHSQGNKTTTASGGTFLMEIGCYTAVQIVTMALTA
jgi:hypothetical protein